MISVIVPAFNEEAIIETTIREIIAAMCGNDYEIVVVDDCSTDQTASIVAKLAHTESHIQLIAKIRHGGKGDALKQGFFKSSGDLIVFMGLFQSEWVNSRSQPNL